MSTSYPALNTLSVCLVATGLCLCASAQAQTQLVKPPIAQYWMDVATISMAGLDEMPDMGAMGGMMGKMTGMPGMGVSFGATRGMMPGRWLDLAVRTQRKPGGTEALQEIPPEQVMGPNLTLLPVKSAPQSKGAPGHEGVDEVPQQPKGRLLFYWGCSDKVRAGQPRVLDFSKAGAADYGKFMMGRATRDNGAKAVVGNAIWPNEEHKQKVSDQASLQGTHVVSGDGIPDGLRFNIGQAQDFMPKLALSTQGGGAVATQTSWQALPTARAYFLTAMSGSEQDGAAEMVIWSSSDVPEPGWGLLDYASNENVDKWLKEKVLLPASQTECKIPEGIFAKAQGAMLRGIAYGQELNLAHPPRPTDKKKPWEPDWAAKIRVKSLSMVMLGEESGGGASGHAPQPDPSESNSAAQQPEAPKLPSIPGLPDVGKALQGLKGLFGK